MNTSMPTAPLRRLPNSLVWLVPLACLIVLMAGELTLGAVSIPLRGVMAGLTGQPSSDPAWETIVRDFRLPRALMAALAGGALGMAGIMLQTLFRNPLADPYVLGLVHGGRLAAALLVVAAGVFGNAYLQRFGLGADIGTALASTLGVGGVLAMLSVLSRRVGPVTLLMTGLMLGFLAVGLISIAMHFVDEHQAMAFKVWDDASFAGATWPQLMLLLPVVVLGVMAALRLAKPLDALLLGERYAESLGADPRRTRRHTLAVVALLVGVVTAFCGPVAFVGIVAAQVARALASTARHQRLLPLALMCGAVIALGADWFMHLPWAKEVFHLNAVIGLVGAPVAIIALLRSRGTWRATE